MESLTFSKPSRKLTAAECDATFRARICVHCGKPIVIGPKSLYQEGYGGRALEAEFTIPYSPGDSIKSFLENAGFTVRTQENGRLMIHICQNADRDRSALVRSSNADKFREERSRKIMNDLARVTHEEAQVKRPVQATWVHRASEESVEAEQRAFAMAQLGGNR